MKRFLLASIGLSLILFSCDGGLTLPPDVEPGIAGTIMVTSPWPPQDSVKTLWIFASQIYPLDSSKVVSGILQNKILIYPSIDNTLAYNVNTQAFNFALRPGTYYYIGVLQRFGATLFDPRSYRVVGVLSDSSKPTQPRVLTIHEFEVVAGITLWVDFYNLPPQPF